RISHLARDGHLELVVPSIARHYLRQPELELRLHDAAGPLLDPDQPASGKVIVWPRLDHGRPLPLFKPNCPNIGTNALFDPAAHEVETRAEPRLQKSSRNQRVAQRPDVYEVEPSARF